MAGQLTALGIGKLRTPGKYYDGAHGLFLQVYPSGAKCWQQRLTVSPGRRRTLGLGGYPAVGLAAVSPTSATRGQNAHNSLISGSRKPKAGTTRPRAEGEDKGGFRRRFEAGVGPVVSA